MAKRKIRTAIKQDLMDQLCEEKKLTMLLVTHQPKEIERHIDRVIEIHQGKVI